MAFALKPFQKPNMTTEQKGIPKLIAVSDSALLIEFECKISTEISNQVLALKYAIETVGISGVQECVAGYRSLLVHYDCLRLPLAQLQNALAPLLDQLISSKQSTNLEFKTWRVPVLYRGEGALDLDAVAKLHGLTTDEVVRLHKQSEFRVFMVGFAPGWCYLGGLDPKLATPRLESPRLTVPKGCISIGGQQGMIGGQAMPSGWRLLGQTPVQTYAAKRTPPFFIEVGDRIEFYEVNQRDFNQMQKAADGGEFVAQEVG